MLHTRNIKVKGSLWKAAQTGDFLVSTMKDREQWNTVLKKILTFYPVKNKRSIMETDT